MDTSVLKELIGELSNLYVELKDEKSDMDYCKRRRTEVNCEEVYCDDCLYEHILAICGKYLK